MSRTIIITEDKAETLSGMVSDMLTIGGRLMSCLEELKRGGEMGERGQVGMRDPGMMGERYMGGMPMQERGGYGDRMPMMPGMYPQGGMYPPQGGYMGERRRRY